MINHIHKMSNKICISLYKYDQIISDDYVLDIYKSKYTKMYKRDKLLLLRKKYNFYNKPANISLGLYYYISDLDSYIFICVFHFYKLGYRVYSLFDEDTFVYRETTNLKEIKNIMLSYATYKILKDIMYIASYSFLL